MNTINFVIRDDIDVNATIEYSSEEWEITMIYDNKKYFNKGMRQSNNDILDHFSENELNDFVELVSKYPVLCFNNDISDSLIVSNLFSVILKFEMRLELKSPEYVEAMIYPTRLEEKVKTLEKKIIMLENIVGDMIKSNDDSKTSEISEKSTLIYSCDGDVWYSHFGKDIWNDVILPDLLKTYKEDDYSKRLTERMEYSLKNEVKDIHDYDKICAGGYKLCINHMIKRLYKLGYEAEVVGCAADSVDLYQFMSKRCEAVFNSYHQKYTIVMNVTHTGIKQNIELFCINSLGNSRRNGYGRGIQDGDWDIAEKFVSRGNETIMIFKKRIE